MNKKAKDKIFAHLRGIDNATSDIDVMANRFASVGFSEISKNLKLLVKPIQSNLLEIKKVFDLTDEDE